MGETKEKYDGIAVKYVAAKEWKRAELNFRVPVEHYTIDHCLLGSFLDDQGLLTGKRVLDLACGNGYHTRRLKALDCAYILGVDVSSSMIELAREFEVKDPQQIEYMVADVKYLPPPEQPYDLVTGFYLLNYAKTREELLQMARVIYTQLGENKLFVGLTVNVVAGKDAFDNRKYGVVRYTKEPLPDGPIPNGTEVMVSFLDEQGEPMCTLSNYFLLPTTYEQVFKEAGFKSFEWVPIQCDPKTPNKEFFNDLVKCGPGIGIIVRK